MMFLVYGFVIVAMVALDQITKYLIASNFLLGERLELIPGFLSLTHVRNTGAGFSILEGQMTFFYIVTVIALVVLVYLFVKTEKKDYLTRFSYLFMIGGALGNFIDRIRLNYVVDFIDVLIFGYDFPVFNVADILLTVGVGLFILSYILELKHGKA